MGIDIESYRMRIGCNKMGKYAGKVHNSVYYSGNDGRSFCIRPSVILIVTLLVIAGLETNPGPKSKTLREINANALAETVATRHDNCVKSENREVICVRKRLSERPEPYTTSRYRQKKGMVKEKDSQMLAHVNQTDHQILPDLDLTSILESFQVEYSGNCTELPDTEMNQSIPRMNEINQKGNTQMNKSIPRMHEMNLTVNDFHLLPDLTEVSMLESFEPEYVGNCSEFPIIEMIPLVKFEKDCEVSESFPGHKCCFCSGLFQRSKVVIWRKSNYSLELASANFTRNSFVCKECHEIQKIAKKLDVQPSDFICVVCSQRFQRRDVVIFVRRNYDCGNPNVAECITSVPVGVKRKLFVCKTCHNFMKQCSKSEHTENDDLFSAGILRLRANALENKKECVGDRGGDCICDQCVTQIRLLQQAEVAFMKQIRESMDFICIVCHRALFRTSVLEFSEFKYDWSNIAVQQAFSVQRFERNGKCFVCRTCHESLKTMKKRVKLPALPAQAVANNFDVEIPPPELANLNDLEIRFIAQKIPFMKLVTLPKGGQKGLQGPCVNIPSNINDVCNVFPRFAENINVVQFALKRKICYKNFYMQMPVDPSKIMAALSWLVAKNPFYRNVAINHNWALYAQENIQMRMITGEIEGSDVVREESPDTHDQLQKEFEDDQSAANRMGEISIMPTCSVIHREDVEGYIYEMAPGQGNKPQSVLRDPDMEVLAFPNLFPTGKFAFDIAERQTKLYMRRYLDRQLLHYSGRFAANREWLFAIQYRVTEEQVNSQQGIAMCLKKGNKYNGRTVNAGMLKDPCVFSSMQHEGFAYKFLKQVRGSPPYWKHQMLETLAMVRSCGVPTFFFTLSAAEYCWTEMIVALAKRYGLEITENDAKCLSWEMKTKILNNNPVLAVKLFENRVQALFDCYLKSDAHPIGFITDYVIKIEFQARGSPHAHCLLWIKDAPKLKDHSLDVVSRFISKHVTCKIPQDDDVLADLVKSRQSHRHSEYCRRKNKCRFGFPKPLSFKTMVTEKLTDSEVHVSEMKKAKETLDKFVEFFEKEQEMGLEDLLLAAGITCDEYHSALLKSTNGHKIILKRYREELQTNNYNGGILKLWQANMDIQYITDPVSAVMYVCSYMMKSDAAMGELLKAVTKEFLHEDVYMQMKKTGNAFLSAREVSQQEAIMLGTGMRLMRKSRAVKFVSTNVPEERIKLPRRDYRLLDDDDNDVFQCSIHEWYGARPGLSLMCLADFVTVYNVGGNSGEDETELCEEHHVEDIPGVGQENLSYPEKITVKLGSKVRVFKKRKRPAILRAHIPEVSNDAEAHFYANLVLFYPWRQEQEFESASDTQFMDFYYTCEHKVKGNADRYNYDNDEITKAWCTVNAGHLPQSAWDELAPGAEEENAAARYQGMNIERDLDVEPGDIPDEDHYTSKGRDVLSKRFDVAAKKIVMDTATYKKHYLMLNAKQRDAVHFNREHLKLCVVADSKGLPQPKGYKMFLSGPGGTGKSFVLQMIQRDTHYFMNQHRINNPENPLILMTAFTGTAAFVIDGITLHSALGLGSFSDHLSHKKRAILQTRLENLVTLVIDECSMVSPNCLVDVHNRLWIAKKSQDREDCFGNVNIMCVGDLYQLSPVKAKHIFQVPSNCGGTSHLSSLWKEHFDYIELTEPMRQNDKKLSDLLLSIRTGPPVEGSVEDCLLKSCQMTLNELDASYPKDALHVYAQNEHCHDRNMRRLAQVEGDMIELTATDTTREPNTNVKDFTFPSNPMKTGRLRSVLHLKEGARVMLTDNLDVTDGLTNGAMGTVTAFIFEVNPVQNKRVVRAVLVKFDSKKVGKNAIGHSAYKTTCPNSVPIKRVMKEFPIVPSNVNPAVLMRRMNTVKCQRSQFPLFLAWAVTVHRVQGMTLDEIVVEMSLKKGRYSAGMAYVAFSRIRSIDKLHILNYNRTQIKSDNQVNTEIERLRRTSISHNQRNVFNSLEEGGLKMTNLNVRGLNESKCFFRGLPDIERSDICCFTETHLAKNSPLVVESFPSDHFQVFRKDRNSEGGGVAIFVHKNCCPFEIPVVCNIELVAVHITKPFQMVVLCVYRPPSLGLVTFANQIENVLSMLQTECFPSVPFFVLGDMNINLVKNPRNVLLQSLSSIGLTQIVNQATHDSGSLIDHVYTSHPNTIVHYVSDCFFSDHDAIFMYINE